VPFKAGLTVTGNKYKITETIHTPLFKKVIFDLFLLCPAIFKKFSEENS
jgi:hypothetical protein